jgi:hypothetical protein
MDVRDARLLMKSFDALTEQLNLPFYIVENFCENDVKEAVTTAFANLIREIDYEVLPKLISRFPELKDEIRASQEFKPEING